MYLKKYQSGGNNTAFLDFIKNVNNRPIVDKGNFSTQLGNTPYQQKSLNNTLKKIKKAEKENELLDTIASYKQAENFHKINPLNFRKKEPTSVPKQSFKQNLNDFGAAIENFYEIPKIGIANDFINPLHLVSSGIIAPIAQAPQQSEDINNYYEDNDKPLFINKTVDKYIPYGLAGVSTLMTAPFVKGAVGINKTAFNLPKNIGKIYRDIKYPTNMIIKDGKKYFNSEDLFKNNTFENGLKKSEINFLNKELEDRGILESQRRHPFDIRSEISRRAVVPEDYNLRQIAKDFLPNLVKGKKYVDSKYTMGDMRKNAFNQYLGIPTKNTAYRVHSNSFKSGKDLVYTMPEHLIDRSTSKEPLSAFNEDELGTIKYLENYYKNPTNENKELLFQDTKQRYPHALINSKKGFNPDNLVHNNFYDYGKPIIKGNKTVIPTWDYITGTGGGASFTKQGNKIALKDKWDIHPFSRNRILPKFIRNFDAGNVLGGKSFDLIQEYNIKNGIKQLFKNGGNKY